VRAIGFDIASRCVTTSKRRGKRLERTGLLLSFDNPGGAWQSTRLIWGGSPRDTDIMSVFSPLGLEALVGLPEEKAWLKRNGG
jgi:hypothetical protein